MSGTSQKAVRVFANTGQVSEIDLALGRAEKPPTSHELQRIIFEPPIRDAVVAALRQTSLFREEPIPAEQLLERELQALAYAQELTKDFPSVEEEQVKRVIEKKQKATGVLSTWDYFQPEGLAISTGLSLFSALGFKFYMEEGSEWWRKEKEIEFLPTKVGIMTCDFRRVGTFFDIQLRPFNLNYEEQIAWAKEQGGDTIYSVEEAFYRNFRGYQLLGYPIGFNGRERCRNKDDSGFSQVLCWNAGRGLGVNVESVNDRNWLDGAFPRKFLSP